jgi:hypothetical protein
MHLIHFKSVRELHQRRNAAPEGLYPAASTSTRSQVTNHAVNDASVFVSWSFCQARLTPTVEDGDDESGVMPECKRKPL